MVEHNPGIDDTELLRRAASGDPKAFHALVDRHADRLHRLAYSLVGNNADAEDVLQETFAGAFAGLKKFEERASVKTWLTRILVTQAALSRRKRKRRPTESIGDLTKLPISSGTGAGIDAKFDLRAVLQLLSPEHRQVLVLREFERMSYEEIAAVVGVAQGTIESRLHRARNELRERLKAYGKNQM